MRNLKDIARKAFEAEVIGPRGYSSKRNEDGLYVQDGVQSSWRSFCQGYQSASNQASCKGLIHLTRDHWQALSQLEYAVRQGRGHASITEALERLSEIHNRPVNGDGADIDDGTNSAPETTERVLALLGHHRTESTRCRARYKQVDPSPQGPINPPVFCVLDTGHDGPHHGQHGAKMRESLIEFGPAINVCAKCKVRWPCKEAEKIVEALSISMPAASKSQGVPKGWSIKREGGDLILSKHGEDAYSTHMPAETADTLAAFMTEFLLAPISAPTAPQADEWVKCADRLPTEADADPWGCAALLIPEYENYCESAPPLRVDVSRIPEIYENHPSALWTRTGITRPQPPEQEGE